MPSWNKTQFSVEFRFHDYEGSALSQNITFNFPQLIPHRGNHLVLEMIALLFGVSSCSSKIISWTWPVDSSVSAYQRSTYVASTAPGLTTTSILYLEPVSSLMVRVWPNLAPSDLKYTALLLGSIFREIPILTTWGTSAMLQGCSRGRNRSLSKCRSVDADGEMPCEDAHNTICADCNPAKSTALT